MNLREFNTQNIRLPYKTIIDNKEEKPVYYEQRDRVTVESPTRVVVGSRPEANRPQSQPKSPTPMIIPQQTVVVNRV